MNIVQEDSKGQDPDWAMDNEDGEEYDEAMGEVKAEIDEGISWDDDKPLFEDVKDHKKMGTKPGKRHKCTKCDYSATKTWRVRRHMEEKHETLQLPCEQCDQVFPSSFSLQRHVNVVHIGLSFPCSECDFKAKSTSQG